MKFWLFVIFGWFMAVSLLMVGSSQYYKRVLIQNHGHDLGMALWREYKPW